MIKQFPPDLYDIPYILLSFIKPVHLVIAGPILKKLYIYSIYQRIFRYFVLE
jgi:hypothetical protein